MFKTEKEFAQYVSGISGTAFLVGGAVRDEILGRPVKDRDYVIVGVDQEQLNRWNSVGNQFPVYLVEIGGETCQEGTEKWDRPLWIRS